MSKSDNSIRNGRDHFGPNIGSDRVRAPARARFFDILDQECPEAREELHRDVWSRFRHRIREIGESFNEAAEEDATTFSDWLVRLVPSFDFGQWFYDARATGDPLAAEIATAVESWAKKYRLHDDWITDVVICTLARWEAEPSFEEEGSWCFPSTGIWGAPLSRAEERFTFSLEGAWNPSTTPRPKAANRIRRAFNKSLQDWLDKTEMAADKRGYPKLKKKKKLEKHLRWLVQYQTSDISYTKLAKGLGLADPEHKGRRTVTEGVTTAAELISLTLREADRGGRPSQST